MKNCPHCGAEDALESVLRIDLDDIELEPNPTDASTAHWAKWRVKDFVPAGSANDPITGIVFEEASISCRECGEEIGDADFPWRFADRWTYGETPPARVVTLTIRDPDYPNDQITDVIGNVEIEHIEVDLGSQFNGPKDFEPESDWGQQWLADHRESVAHLPADSEVRLAVENVCDDLESGS